MVKPVRGYGALGVRLSEGPAGEGEFGQEVHRGRTSLGLPSGPASSATSARDWSGDPRSCSP